MYKRRRVDGPLQTLSQPYKPLSIKGRSADDSPAVSQSSPSSHSSKDVCTPLPLERRVLAEKSTNVNQFIVVWRKKSTKKNVTWDGDGSVKFQDGMAVLKNDSGKVIGRGRNSGQVAVGDVVSLGSYEVEVVSADKDETASQPASAVSVTSSVFPQLPTFSPSARRKPANINTQPLHDPKAPGAIVLPRISPEPLDRKVIDVVIDPLLGAKLRPHQIDGVEFLYRCVMGMKHYKGRGALLADEMGLGKTLMTITLLWTLMKQNPISGETPVVKRALIVCPVTLISNWKKEFTKWLGPHRVSIFVADSNANIRDFASSRVYQVMLVGYERVRTIVADLKSTDFDLIVCDEGHRLKSSTNKSAQAILALNNSRRIILSGTPIQNDLGEFFVMIDFLNPGLLGSYAAFKKDFEIPIVRSRQLGASSKDVAKGQLKSSELSELTQQFILRRSAKTLDSYLPPKTETVVFCQPTERQLTLYRSLLNSKEIQECLGSEDTSQHLKAITLLKKVCNSPLLVDDELNARKLLSAANLSGKTKVLQRLLRTVFDTTNEKVVVVSGYTQTLDLLESILKANNMAFVRLDGSTPQNKRQGLIERFNTSPQKESFVFLMSSKSGGTGVNLVGASRLVLFDPDWNPSVDLQAMARIHRDGQRRPVYIYRFLIAGAMDEKVFQRQVSKQGLADQFMGDGPEETDKTKSETDSFTTTDLRDLFTLNEGVASNTHDLLECECTGDKLLPDSVPCSRSSSIEPGGVEEIIYSQTSSGGEFGDLGGWMSAKTVAQSGVHLPERLKLKEKMKGLFSYKHIDPQAGVDNYGDEVLAKILSESGNMVSFLFTRSTAQDMQNAVDSSSPGA